MLHVTFIGALSNCDDSILKVNNAGLSFKISKVRVSELISELCKSAGQNAEICRADLTIEFYKKGIADPIPGAYGYVAEVEGAYDEAWPDPVNVYFWLNEKLRDDVSRVYSEIELLRLFKRGNLSIQYAAILIKDDNQKEAMYPFMIYPGSDYVEADKYTLSEDELEPIASFLNFFRYEQLPGDLALAFSNYNASFGFSQSWPFVAAKGEVVAYGSIASFLMIMVGLENLVNKDPNAVTETISRNLALLLGSDETSSREIYRCMKRIYDERSKIVHGSIDDEDVLKKFECYKVKARDYLREAIKNAWTAEKKLGLSVEQLLDKFACLSFCSERPWRDEITGKFLLKLSGCDECK